MGEQFDRAVSMNELCRAIRECKRGVSYKDGPTDWYLHRLAKAEALQRDILNGRYKLRPGRKVQIYRPKRREAIAPYFRDRVWQRSMCNNGLYRDLTSGLIYDNYACQKGRGTDKAIRRTVCFMERLFRESGTNRVYGIHIDVKKYFPSTPQALVKALDEKNVTERSYLPYLRDITDSIPDERPNEEVEGDPFGKRGIGLGSQISQIHQVALLNRIDHELKTFCRYYQRYMDDFLVLSADRETCRRASRIVLDMLCEMGFSGVDKAGVFSLADGFTFLRHRFVLTASGKVVVRLHRDAFRNERKALKKMHGLLQAGAVSQADVFAKLQSFTAQTAYCTGYGAIRSMDYYFRALFHTNPNHKKKVRKNLHEYHQKRQQHVP